jgi:hypothetical protein
MSAMPTVKKVISRIGVPESHRIVLHQFIIETGTDKRMTSQRTARILAQYCPGFRRRKGRYASTAGVQILPIMEKTENGWRALRLETGDDSPSGYEPPLPGRAGKLSSANNPFANLSKGVWLRADIFEG